MASVVRDEEEFILRFGRTSLDFLRPPVHHEPLLSRNDQVRYRVARLTQFLIARPREELMLWEWLSRRESYLSSVVNPQEPERVMGWLEFPVKYNVTNPEMELPVVSSSSCAYDSPFQTDRSPSYAHLQEEAIANGSIWSPLSSHSSPPLSQSKAPAPSFTKADPEPPISLHEATSASSSPAQRLVQEDEPKIPVPLTVEDQASLDPAQNTPTLLTDQTSWQQSIGAVEILYDMACSNQTTQAAPPNHLHYIPMSEWAQQPLESEDAIFARLLEAHTYLSRQQQMALGGLNELTTTTASLNNTCSNGRSQSESTPSGRKRKVKEPTDAVMHSPATTASRKTKPKKQKTVDETNRDGMLWKEWSTKTDIQSIVPSFMKCRSSLIDAANTCLTWYSSQLKQQKDGAKVEPFVNLFEDWSKLDEKKLNNESHSGQEHFRKLLSTEKHNADGAILRSSLMATFLHHLRPSLSSGFRELESQGEVISHELSKVGKKVKQVFQENEEADLEWDALQSQLDQAVSSWQQHHHQADGLMGRLNSILGRYNHFASKLLSLV